MRQITPRFWLGGAGVIAVAVVVVLLLIHVRPREHSYPIELAWSGWSTQRPGRMVLLVTNHSSRPVRYQVLRTELKRGEGWSECLGGSAFNWTPVSSKQNSPVSIVRGSSLGYWILTTTTNTLPGFSVHAYEMARPLHINGLNGASSWRVAIGWKYAAPSRLDALRAWIENVIGRRLPTFSPPGGTNYSSEIKI